MARWTKSNFLFLRCVVCAASALVCASILAPPLLEHHGDPVAANMFRLLFSPVCHQAPDRSFALLGSSLAVCHRCTGIYFGLLLGPLFANRWLRLSARMRQRWILAAIIPLVIDALIPYSGLSGNTCLSRSLTGLWFGMASASLLTCGLSEFLNEIHWPRFAPIAVHIEGGSCE